MYDIIIYNKENVEPLLSLVPLVKAFALPGLSKRATLIQRQYNVYSHAENRRSVFGNEGATE